MEYNEYSGERFLPEMHDAELEIEHLQRYYTTQALINNMVVLDAACGEGYGSNILAQKAQKVIGIDVDAKTIENAKIKYAATSNLDFYLGSIESLEMIEDFSIDAVVSFETIEHVTPQVQKNFLKEIKRVLKPSGFLIMSTPNKKEYTDRYHFHNQFHVAEFYVDEFVSFLKTAFTNIQLYDQYLEVASFISQSNVDVENTLFVKDSQKYNPVGKYIIAIASNSSSLQHRISSIFMHHEETYLPTLDELNYCRQEAITCRKKAQNLDICLNENKLQKEELDRRAVELDNRMKIINELRQANSIIENENKLQKEELDRRAVELDNRMRLINSLRNHT